MKKMKNLFKKFPSNKITFKKFVLNNKIFNIVGSKNGIKMFVCCSFWGYLWKTSTKEIDESKEPEFW